MRSDKERRRATPSSFKPLGLGISLILALGFLGCGEEGPQVLTFPEGADLNWIQYVTPGLAPTGSYGWSGSGSNGLTEHFDFDGKKGGTFTSGHATLVFPPQAVDGQFTLTIRQINNEDGVWEFDLQPRVARFNRAVTLEIDYLGYSESGDHTILWLDELQGVWIDIGGKDFPNKGYCTIDLSHFSTYGVTDGTAGWE